MSEKYLVCKGATVYCNKSVVNNNPDMAVPLNITSQTLALLNGGKAAATDKDCTPANMCFGNCKCGTNPPPPCVANIQWSKYYENAEVTEAGLKLLTEESEGTCTTCGGKVKIAYHGQVATPQPDEKKEVSKEVLATILPVEPEKNQNPIIENREPQPKIIDAYWIDKQKNKRHELDLTVPVTLYVKVDNPIPGKTVSLKFNDMDDKKYKMVNCSGVIDSEGIIEIKNFKVELENNDIWDGSN